MSNATPSRREPITLAAGETINFQRNFPLYAQPAWVIRYEIRGAGVPIEFTTTAPTNGGTGDQLAFVAGSTTEGWPPGDWEMAGYAENSSTGEKYAVYLGAITITPDLETAPGDLSTVTFAQSMVTKLEAVMQGRATNDVLDSSINGTMIRRIPIKDLKELYFSFRRQRQGEIATQRAKNGQPTGRRITTSLSVTFPNPQLGTPDAFGPGFIYRGNI